MRAKVFYSIFAVAMVIFLLSLVIILSVVYGNFSDSYTEELRNETYYLVSAIEEVGYQFLETIPDDVTDGVTLISADGEVMIDNFSDPEDMKMGFMLEEFIEAREGGIGESFRYSTERGASMVHCAMMLSDGSVLRVSSVRYTVMTLFIDLISPILIIIAVAIVLSLLLAARLSSSITRPINEIDLDSPDERDVYPELRPFVLKIREQNRELDRQMKVLRSEHEMKDTYRREFTANVSHELKTPLTSISGAAELMAAGLVKSEDIPRFAENIYGEAKRMITLVNDIMELSRLDENAIPEMSELELSELSQDIAKRLYKKAQERSVSLSVGGGPVRMLGVEKVVYEIIYNLTENAIKYNKRGGSVNISVGETESGAYVSVVDTGIGIPDDEKDRVFERFYRVDKSHSGETEGTGLGLSIVKHGVMLHGGTLELESKLGVGTAVTVMFPK